MNIQLLIINNIPQWEFILLLTVVIALFVIVTANIIHKFFPGVTHVDNQNLVYSMINVISTYYAVLMGFVIIVLWQAYSKATVIVDTEASHLAIILRDSAVFPKVFHAQFSAAIGEYINNVMGDEWPAMQWGNISPLAEKSLEKIYTILQSFVPENDLQNTYYRDIITHLNSAMETRRQRILAVDSILPDPLRVIMSVGAVGIPAFLALVEIRNKALHQFIIIVVSCILGFNLGFALNLDYPFSGKLKVSEAPFTRGILAQFQPKQT